MWLSATLLTAGAYGPVMVFRMSDDNFSEITPNSLQAMRSARSSKISLTVSSMIREYGGKPKSLLSSRSALLKTDAVFCAML